MNERGKTPEAASDERTNGTMVSRSMTDAAQLAGSPNAPEQIEPPDDDDGHTQCTHERLFVAYESSISENCLYGTRPQDEQRRR